ncbi:phytoene desaturase [Bacillus timonensis]|nr:phytoene desaturase [Bacillus timonensis]
MKRVAIIGGGLAGLSAAITLQYQGFQVAIYEKNAHFGGKLMPVKLGSYHFDFGPNTITMPEIFKNVITQTGEKSEDYFNIVKLNTHTRNFFSDGSTLDFTTDRNKMKKQLELFDPIGATRYTSFLNDVQKLYQLSEEQFFPRLFQSWKDYFSPSLPRAFMKVKPHMSLNRFISTYFKDERVKYTLNRYATYIGSSPYITPATFAMIAYLELVDGVYYVEGGNTNLAVGFEKLARKLGVELYLNCEVKKINVSGKKVTSLTIEDEKVPADYVIMNADLLYSYPSLVDEEDRPHFKDKKVQSYQPSISAFVILAGMKNRNKRFLHHNVLFPNSYKEEFKQLFNGEYVDDPTIYISNSSVTDPSRSPDGDNLFILINAPALQGEGAKMIDSETYKQKLYEKLIRHSMFSPENLAFEKIFTPADIKSTFHSYRGALYGVSSNRKINAFLRPSNFSKDISNLFFVGGSTHPGGGSPMVTISGQNVANYLVKASKRESYKL